MKFKLFKDKKGEFRWNLVASNGRIIATSGEGYKKKAGALKGIDAVTKVATATVEEEPAK